MATIVNTETDEVVFESDDPQAILEEANRLGEEWGGEGLPYAVRGFDSQELESGVTREYTPPTPPPLDKDRLVVNEETRTVEVYGDASPPVPGPNGLEMDVVIME